MSGTPWFAGPMLAFDLESTGVDVETAHIVTAAAIQLGGGQQVVTREWMAAVEIDIPEEATRVHGISTAEARAKGVPPKEMLDELAEVLSVALRAAVPIVGHNVVYDLTLFDRELRRRGLPTLTERSNRSGPVICTRVLDQHVLPFRRRPSKEQGARTLKTTAQVYGLGWDEAAAHGSTYDAMQAARIAYRIGRIGFTPHGERPEWVQQERSQQFDDVAVPLHELWMAQQKWAYEQAEGLEQWFRTKATAEQGGDPKKVILKSWPMHPFEATA